MKPKHHAILYTFLSVALVIAVLLTFEYVGKAEAASGALEDSYTRSVLETQERLQTITLKLNKAQLAEGCSQLTGLLAEISKQADSVVTELSALPLSHAAMSDTIKFCNQLSEYALALALSAGDMLNDEDAKRLSELESQCALLSGQFATAREQMLRESLQMATLQNVYYQEAQLAARPLEQVADSDNGMDYPTMIYDGAFSDARHYGEPKALGGETIDAKRAVELAVRFVGAERVRDSALGVETEGTLAAFGVTVNLTDGTALNVDITKRGGKVLWMMPEHASFAASLTLDECTEKARLFLRERGYTSLEANHYQVYDGLAVINFVPAQAGVLLYPDLIKAQVRMDTGDVVGLEANNYLMHHVARDSLSPTLTREQALARVNARLQATAARLCVIPYRDAERLCWEIDGTYADSRYLAYLDAATGEQLELLMLLQTSDGMLSATRGFHPLDS